MDLSLDCTAIAPPHRERERERERETFDQFGLVDLWLDLLFVIQLPITVSFVFLIQQLQ